MNDEDAPRRRGLRALFVDTTPIKESPAFARLWAGTSIGIIGSQVTIVAVSLHIWELTLSTFAVALVGVWALGPMILAGLIGGDLSDRFDRRLVSLVTATVAWCSVAVMTVIAFLGVDATWPYYALASVNAAASTIMGAARGAILPRLLPARLLPAASALNGITMGFAVTVGPAIAGLLVAWVGFSWTYLLDAVLFLGTFVGILGLPRIEPEGGSRSSGLRAIKESVVFLKRAPSVQATFVFDLIAMIFGSPRVIFPALGALVIGGGAVTVGLLTSALAFGALVSGIFSGPLGAVRMQGRAVTYAIITYGVFISLFGVVVLVTQLLGGTPADGSMLFTAMVLASLALIGAGAADNVSAIFRMTILQVAVPDGVRGRMQGLFYVVVTGGVRVGDFVAGLAAAAFALWAPALIGGIVIVGLMLLMFRVYREFQQYDAHDPRA